MPSSIFFKSDVKDTIWLTVSLNLYTASPSCGRTIACTNLRAEVSSSGRSFLVLRLVSTARNIESGSADSLLKMAIVCSLPSSFSTKFSFCRLATGAPRASVTVTNTFTSFTSTLIVVSGSSAISVRLAERMKAHTIMGKRFELRTTSCERTAAKVARISRPPARRVLVITFIRESIFRMQYLGCRLRPRCASRPPNFFGKCLTIGPYCSIFKMFFLPDRHRLFQRVNDPAAGLKRRCPVRRRDHDQHACFSNFQTAQTMDD